MTNGSERMELKVFSVALYMQSTVDAGPGPFSGRTLDLCRVCMYGFQDFMTDQERTS